MMLNKMRMNLQYFAEPDQDPGGGDPEKLSLTQEELDAKINSEYDRRVAKQQEKWNQKLEEAKKSAMEEGLSEGQKRAKMTAKEQADEDQKQREAALSKREAELNKRELTANTTDLLNEKGLPKDLAEALVELGDADKISAVVDTLQKSTEQQVNDQVKEQLRQDAPNNSSSVLDDTSNPFNQHLSKYNE